MDSALIPPKPPPDNMLYKIGRDFVAGACASGLGKFIFSGVERVKPFASLVSQPHYDFYYWPRNIANIARAMPVDGLAFSFNDHYKRTFAVSEIDYAKDPLNFYLKTLAAGAAAGATTLLLVYPFAANELIVEEQPKHKYRESDKLGHRWRTSGIVGVYRGFLPSVTCAAVYRAGYFGFYDTAKIVYLQHYPARNNFFMSWFVAWMTTSTAALMTYPFDVVRRRVISMQHDRHHRQHATTWNALREVSKGVNDGFYRGAAFNTLRSIGGAMALAFYDLIRLNVMKQYETIMFGTNS